MHGLPSGNMAGLGGAGQQQLTGMGAATAALSCDSVRRVTSAAVQAATNCC